MPIQSIIDAQAELAKKPDSNSINDNIVLSSRIRLARNLDGIAFPGWAKEHEKKNVLSNVFESLEKLPQMEEGTAIKLETLNKLEKQILLERHLISQELINTSSNAGIFVNKDQSCSIMINEEDHLRIQYLGKGLQLESVWQKISDIDNALEQKLEYAFSTEIGYLTSCPTNVGTGMRVSAMMHLPALVIAGHMEKVIRALNQVGITVRGLFGEGSQANGSIFQISNQQTLGVSEEEIISNLQKFILAIIEHENNSREKLVEDKPEKLFDQIGRAYGLFKHSYLLNPIESINLLSFIRLAIELKLITTPLDLSENLNRIYIEGQAAHIEYATTKDNLPETEDKEQDRHRALYFAKQFLDLPVPNFDKQN